MPTSATVNEVLRAVGRILAPPDLREPLASRDWAAAEWLAYYSECRKFLLVLGEKFSSLVVQSSVYVFAAAGAVVALKQISTSQRAAVLVTAPAGLALVFFWYVAIRYARQAQAVGTILSRIEADRLALPPDLALLSSLRGARLALFNRRFTRAGLHVYFILLLLVLASVTLVPSVSHATMVGK